MKRLLGLILILLLCLTLGSCGTAVGETEAKTDNVTENETAAETEENVYVKRSYTMADAEGLYRPLGRTAMLETSQTCDWTASGAEFLADCQGDVNMVFTALGEICLTIVVDGQVTKDFAVKAGTNSYTIAKDLTPGLHTIRIVAQYAYTRASLDKIEITGVLEKAKPSKAYIEFIGDSVTCGSGLSTDGSQDGTKAYAYVAADILDAEYSICANGGMGIAFSRDDGTNVVANVYPYQNAKRDNTPYTPTRTPSLIVINLHTNDNWQWYSQVKNKTDDAIFNYENFDAAFDKFIGTIDDLYGEKKISMLFVFGCMANPSYTVATDRVCKLIEEKYVPDGYDMEIVTLTTDRSGASSHPAAAGAQKQGEELAAHIQHMYPWLFK